VNPLAITIIIRARNEAPDLGRCLELLGRQQITGTEVEVIVVDNDSTDATAAIASHHGATVLRLPREQFSFGRALNLAAVQAKGEIVVALSAHAFALEPGWLARLAAAMEDPQVACASGESYRPDGSPLTEPVIYGPALLAAEPLWGFSNAAGAFRASLWRERGFREDLPGCEDKEWCRYWVQRGFVCVLDPALIVDHDHTHDPVLSIYRRARREAEGMCAFLPPDLAPAHDAVALLREWFLDTRFYDDPWRARLSHRRAARLLGTYAGAQAGGSSPNGTRSTRLRAWIMRRWRKASGKRRNAST
jgi:rhamnosyltransferase